MHIYAYLLKIYRISWNLYVVILTSYNEYTVVVSCFVKIELFGTKLKIILQQRNDRTVSHNDRT